MILYSNNKYNKKMDLETQKMKKSQKQHKNQILNILQDKRQMNY